MMTTFLYLLIQGAILLTAVGCLVLRHYYPEVDPVVVILLALLDTNGITSALAVTKQPNQTT